MRAYLPNRVLAAGLEDTSVPRLLEGRTAREGRATAYVCRDFACESPVTDPVILAGRLGV